MTKREIEELAFQLIKSGNCITEDTKDSEYLSDEDKRQLVIDFREAKLDGDEESAKAIMSILYAEVENLIYKYAHKYAYNDDQDEVHELTMEGTEALINGIAGDEEADTGYNPVGDVPFNMYVIKTIKGAMMNFKRKEAKHKEKIPVSMDAPVSGEDGDANMYNIEDLAEEDSHAGLLEDDVLELLDELPNTQERNKLIFKKYFGLDDEFRKTYKEISEEHNISKQAVAAIINRVVEKLKDILNQN